MDANKKYAKVDIGRDEMLVVPSTFNIQMNLDGGFLCLGDNGNMNFQNSHGNFYTTLSDTLFTFDSVTKVSNFLVFLSLYNEIPSNLTKSFALISDAGGCIPKPMNVIELILEIYEISKTYQLDNYDHLNYEDYIKKLVNKQDSLLTYHTLLVADDNELSVENYHFVDEVLLYNKAVEIVKKKLNINK